MDARAEVSTPRLRRTSRRIAWSLAAALLVTGCAANREARRGEVAFPDEISQALGWLPANCETLFVANGPFVLLDSDPGHHRPEERTSPRDELLDALRGQAAEAALGASDQGEALLGGARVRFALEGARNFRAPKGLGEFRFDGAAIVSFDPASRAAVDAYYSDCLAHATARKTVREREVVTTRRKVESEEWTFHVVRPGPDLLIGATDAAFLDELLARADLNTPFEPPPVLCDWSRFEPRTLVWAARRVKGPQSAAQELELGYFLAESERPKDLRLSVRLAGPAELLAKVRASMQENLRSCAKPLARPLPDGEADFVIDVSDSKATGDACWFLLALIGHVMQL